MHDYDSSELLPSGVHVPGNCPPLPLLRAWQAGVLPEEIVHDVASHVGSCRICSGLLADLDQLPEPTLTPAERERIRRKLPFLVSEEHRRPTWKWYSVAAAVAVVAMGTVFLAVRETRRSTQTAVQVQTTPPSPAAPSAPRSISPAIPQVQVARLDPPLSLAPNMVLRGEASSAQPTAAQLRPAFHAYSSGDYPQAIALFSQLAKQFPRSGTPFLYLGVSQLLTNDDAEAVFNLTRAEKFADASQRDAASWYLLAASVRTQAPDAAQRAHDLCARGDRSSYSNQACELEKALTPK
ncbi:MAG TPA: hypothetical protein VIM60_07875 [Edaphobacter sp.]